MDHENLKLKVSKTLKHFLKGYIFIGLPFKLYHFYGFYTIFKVLILRKESDIMPVYKDKVPTKDGRIWFYKTRYTDIFGNKKQIYINLTINAKKRQVLNSRENIMYIKS